MNNGACGDGVGSSNPVSGSVGCCLLCIMFTLYNYVAAWVMYVSSSTPGIVFAYATCSPRKHISAKHIAAKF